VVPVDDLLDAFAEWLADIDAEPFKYEHLTVGDIREESAR
jgi:hypothetical protein